MTREKARFSNLKALIVTHSFSTGPSQKLEEFLKDRVKTLAFIDHPFSYCNQICSSLTLYKNGDIKKKVVAPPIKGPDFVFYLKDVFFTIYFALKAREKFDVCVAADNLNALAGLILRKLRIIRRIVYYCIDFTPNRFEHKLMNALYSLVDRICCYNCDFVWNSSAAMVIEREKKGILRAKSSEQLIVPDGNDFDEIERLPVNQINRFDVAFMGHLRKNKGVELLVEVFSDIRKEVPEARLIIIGTGPIERELKMMVKDLGLESCVVFRGYVESHEKLEKLLAQCAVGVAPYVPDPESFSYYSDVMKPKTYMASGLPVVITKVPRIAQEIAKNEAGIAIDYDRQQLINSILNLLTDNELYKKYRENAIRFASHFAWKKIFNETFSKMGLKMPDD